MKTPCENPACGHVDDSEHPAGHICPQPKRAVLRDARDLNWSAAKVAAERIIHICQDAGFTAPEALDVLRGKIALVAAELNTIARALLMTGGGL